MGVSRGDDAKLQSRSQRKKQKKKKRRKEFENKNDNTRYDNTRSMNRVKTCVNNQYFIYPYYLLSCQQQQQQSTLLEADLYARGCTVRRI